MSDWRKLRCLMVDRLGFEKVFQSHNGAHDVYVASPIGMCHGRFVIYGETFRDGEHLLEYREEERMDYRQTLLQPPREVVKEVPPSVDALARAIFETDERVLAFINRVADGPFCLLIEEKWKRCMQRAWDWDEGEWRTEAYERAGEVLAVLQPSEGTKE